MAALDLKEQTIAVIPGTGRMGSLLAGHYAKAGLSLILGSREPEKAHAVAQLISKQTQSSTVKGVSNEKAAAAGDIIIWAPAGPLADREELLKSLVKELENKIIVDVTNIFYYFDESKWGQISAPLLNQKALGVPARWTTAFKATFWKLLEELPDVTNPHYTFVAGDDPTAVATTIALVETIPGFKGVNAGGLQNSKIVELLGPRWLGELDTLNGGGKLRSGWKYVVEFLGRLLKVHLGLQPVRAKELRSFK